MSTQVPQLGASLSSEQKLLLENIRLQEVVGRHEATIAKLQLELKTTTITDKSLTDRMDEFYRDIEEFQQKRNEVPSTPITADAVRHHSAQSLQRQQQQIEKYERMLRIMNNQILLMRGSSDDLVKSLKNQISDMLDEKVRMERTHRDKLSSLEKEKRDMEKSLLRAKEQDTNSKLTLGEKSYRRTLRNHSNNKSSHLTSMTPNCNPTQPPQPPRRHMSIEAMEGTDDDNSTSLNSIHLLREDLKRLQEENEKLKRTSIHVDSANSTSNLNARRSRGHVPLTKTAESAASAAPHPPQRHKSLDDDEQVDTRTIQLLTEDLVRLRTENEQYKRAAGVIPAGENSTVDDIVRDLQKSVQHLTDERTRLDLELANEHGRGRERLAQWTEEKARLEGEIDVLRRRQAPEADARLLLDEFQQWITRNQEVCIEQLDRVALLWDRSVESVQNLERALARGRSLTSDNTDPADSMDRVLSIQETALLIQEQIKVSLMMVELKFRNNLLCLECDSFFPSHDRTIESPVIHEKFQLGLQAIQRDTMDALRQVQALAEDQISRLLSPSIRDASKLSERLDEDSSHVDGSRGGSLNRSVQSSIDMLISHEALETLQNEVLQVIERVKDKNETIDRLTAQVEEYKVRERSLMEELKRHMQDQADRQLVEQQRLMQLHSNGNDGDIDGEVDGSFDDGSSEYEEKTVDDEAFFCEEEVTVYDEETVL